MDIVSAFQNVSTKSDQAQRPSAPAGRSAQPWGAGQPYLFVAAFYRFGDVVALFVSQVNLFF
ncbi:MAG: hypothetical protein V3S67_08660 [Gammaproteobacteria bacterium]